MKAKRLPALFLALILALSLTAPAFAVIATVETPHVTLPSVGGITYETWACLYQDSANTFRGSTWVMNKSYENLPDGYMGLTCDLYSDTRIYASRPMGQNVGGIYFYSRATSDAPVDPGTVYVRGQVALYNRYTGVNEFYSTPIASAVCTAGAYAAQSVPVEDTLAELALTLTADGGYPVTASGKTYGSALLSDLAGEIPELIAAVGIDGREGYVLANELYPEMNGLADAEAYAAYLKTTEDTYRAIPLYDLNEAVIGSFHVQIPSEDEEIPPEIQKTIDELEAARARSAPLPNYPQTELVPAVGTKGEYGYIRRSDYPSAQWDIQTLEDAARYDEFLDTLPPYILVPLYDENGEVIGRFRLQIPGKDEEISAEIQETIHELEARKREAGSSEPPDFLYMEVVPARGTQGEDGYIRRSDFPGAHMPQRTREEVRLYNEFLRTLPAYVLIPLYDENGVVIGRFRVDVNNDSLSEEEIQRQVGRPAAFN